MATDPITTPRSIDDLTKLAGSQIDSEISGQVDPLKQQVTTLQGRETSALQNIGSLFGGIQPYVTSEADKVQGSYDTAFAASQNIFNTAQQRMNDLKNQRAQEAQNMAQKIGGPVAVGEFTASVLPQEQELALTAPNSLLHMLNEAQAGTQEARAFSEKVFPLVRTEEETKARNSFEEQIKTINDEINTLEGGKQGKVNSRLNDLLTQERGFQQNTAQLALDKLKAAHDWTATKRTLHNDDARLKIAQNAAALNKRLGIAGATGVDPKTGKPTLAAVKVSAAEKLAAQKLNLSQAQLNEAIRHHTMTEANAKARLAKSTQINALAILDHAMSPSSKATLTLTHRVKVDAAKGLITKGAFKDPKTGQYWMDVKTTLTPAAAIAQGYNLGGNQPITDPNNLYNLLVGSNVPPAQAIKLIRIKTGLGDFTPGTNVNYTVPSLALMTNREIAGIAKARGYKGGGKRNDLIHYIMMRNLNSGSETGLPTP